MYEEILIRGKQQKKMLTAALKKAAKKKGADKILPELHDTAFKKIDCLNCARCCKNISPRFKTPDIKRISKELGMKESAFIENYLLLDEDGDYVVKNSPCPFLEKDNKCSIYEVRPRDCSKYPYTDSGYFFEYQNTTVQNITYCPAVVTVLEEIAAKVK